MMSHAGVGSPLGRRDRPENPEYWPRHDPGTMPAQCRYKTRKGRVLAGICPGDGKVDTVSESVTECHNACANWPTMDLSHWLPVRFSVFFRGQCHAALLSSSRSCSPSTHKPHTRILSSSPFHINRTFRP